VHGAGTGRLSGIWTGKYGLCRLRRHRHTHRYRILFEGRGRGGLCRGVCCAVFGIRYGGAGGDPVLFLTGNNGDGGVCEVVSEILGLVGRNVERGFRLTCLLLRRRDGQFLEGSGCPESI
jgi:hypothetical protein